MRNNCCAGRCRGILFALGVLLALVGCGTNRPLPPRIVVLFDLSGSTSNAEVRARYLHDFELVVVTTAERRGTVFGELIGRNPAADSATPIAADFRPSPHISGNTLYQHAEARKRVQAVLGQAEALLRRPPQRGTDIVSATVLAARLFARSRESGPRYLVIFSDMLGTRPNLYTANLSARGSEKMVRTLRRSGRIPDLSGVRVFVAGAGAGIGRSRRVLAARHFAIERFWREFFAAAGAEMGPGDYGARLVGWGEASP